MQNTSMAASSSDTGGRLGAMRMVGILRIHTVRERGAGAGHHNTGLLAQREGAFAVPGMAS